MFSNTPSNTMVTNDVRWRPRRDLYRRSKRLLLSLVARSWSAPRNGLELAVRRFLRDRPTSDLARLVRDRSFALAAAASLAAATAAAALPPVNLSRGVSASTGEQMLAAEMTNLEPEDEPVSVTD